MQLPIQSGVVSDKTGYATSYPVNLQHEVVESGISKGQLVLTRGARALVEGPGRDRGGAVFRDVMYRVMGSTLCRLENDDTLTEIGNVGDDGRRAGFTQDFERLAIRSGEHLFYWDEKTLTKVADFDLGKVLDAAWMDGYFVTTDGEFLVVTDLLDPTSVDALRYGSAEADPDPVVGVEVYREELYAFGRYTIQVFRNTGSSGFPFQTIRGATVPYGCVSADAKCRLGDTLAFVGGKRDEPVGVHILAQGSAQRISTPEIDDIIARCDPANIEVEERSFGDERYLIVHLEDCSIALSTRASGQAGGGAWHILHSGNFSAYRLRGAVFHRGRHIVGDLKSNALGVLSFDSEDHFDDTTHWRFEAGLAFNSGLGFIVREVELFGRFPPLNHTVFLSMSRDGQGWSREIGRRLTGRSGERLQWRPNCRIAEQAGFRFRGSSRVAIASAQVKPEGLSI